MNNKTILYIGIILITLPFIGVYSFVKTTIYILIGLYLILTYYKKNKTKDVNKSVSEPTRINSTGTNIPHAEPKTKQRINKM